MAASNQITPKGGYNHVGFDYWSPQTATTKLSFCTDSTGTTVFAKLDPVGLDLEINIINELTAAAGVTIDSVLLKDGGVRLLNNVTFKARNAANDADVDLFKLNASDVFEIVPTSLRYSTSLTISPNTSDGSDTQFLQIGNLTGSRGGYAIFSGNEHALDGETTISSGDQAGGVTIQSLGTGPMRIDVGGLRRLEISSGGIFDFQNATTSGSAGAIAGYMSIKVGSAAYKIPFYAV